MSICFLALAALVFAGAGARAQTVSFASGANSFALVRQGRGAVVMVEDAAPNTVHRVARAFAADVEAVTAVRPRVANAWAAAGGADVVLVGVVGQSEALDALSRAGKLDTAAVKGKWESAVVQVVEHPAPGVRRALVIAGSDRRGAAYALLGLSRQMGVSPWTWWADVPVAHHAEIYVSAARVVSAEPSVRYRGIFLNDEDWGLRPWAAKKMDPAVGSPGPNTYGRIFELLLRLKANSLWPAMHPGTVAFNALPEDPKLADEWGIVMGSSHSEALLRNNVGEWNEKTDGPWNYQLNSKAIDAYWDKRVTENARYENFYTVGMRGVHDSGLEAKGSAEVKARLVEDVMRDQKKILAAHGVAQAPEVIWLYKESLDLYRAGMRVTDDVTLGWTDDNFGYIRQLPTVEEQRRPGGSGVYYHVSYWGNPHDYLWLCSTPPALIQEEMTKAYDHNARRYWVLNVGDLKPAEMDIDYFMQLAWDEPGMAGVSQRVFLERWFAEQFPGAESAKIAAVMGKYYALNFVRKPEHMGFNGYNDGINRTLFNPLAWGDQNAARLAAWKALEEEATALGGHVPEDARAAYFELVGYPVAAAAAQNAKLLYADRAYLDAAAKHDAAADRASAHAAYVRVQALTRKYNGLLGGKWDGMMSADPRQRHVFEDPLVAGTADTGAALPAGWQAGSGVVAQGGAGFGEIDRTVSINAAHFVAKSGQWRVIEGLGISGDSMVYGRPGGLANAPAVTWEVGSAPWLEYAFKTTSSGPTQVTVDVLPGSPVDRQHHLRFALSLDGLAPHLLDASAGSDWKEGAVSAWDKNVLRNAAEVTLQLPGLAAGDHRLRLLYADPGVVFEHVSLTFAGAPAAYPVPPETRQ